MLVINLNIKNKFKSIEFKSLLFIVSFNISIILILWIFEIVFFNYLYKNYQIKTLNNIVEEFNNNEEDVFVLAEELAYKNEVCISVVDDNLIKFNYNTMQVGCALTNNNYITKKIKDFVSSDDYSEYYKINSRNGKTNGILYAFKLNNKNVFIYSSLINGSNFIKIFKTQIVYFILIVIICSCIVSLFIARSITKPIKEITKKAKNLGEGKYDNKFPKNGLLEIDTLSYTLEEVQKELTKNDEVKRDLMANVSHDLKTPLTMIKAYAEMLKDFSYDDKSKRDEHLNIIIEEVDRLNVLVNDILELSKTQANECMYNYEEYDLVKEIKKIIKRYDITKEMENYKFKLELPKKAIVVADKNKINQVIYNLINNAINYTGKDKLVTIRVTKEDNSYLVEIIDTGKGIKKEEIPYIWDKYYKSDKNHQRNVISTGLGLSIVKEILNKHNFEYGVVSKVNYGSTFYFKINL